MCWKILQYTQPQENIITPTIKNYNNEIAITIQAKKFIIRAHAIFKSFLSPKAEYRPNPKIAYLFIQKNNVKINFFAYRLKKSLS